MSTRSTLLKPSRNRGRRWSISSHRCCRCSSNWSASSASRRWTTCGSSRRPVRPCPRRSRPTCARRFRRSCSTTCTVRPRLPSRSPISASMRSQPPMSLCPSAFRCGIHLRWCLIHDCGRFPRVSRVSCTSVVSSWHAGTPHAVTSRPTVLLLTRTGRPDPGCTAPEISCAVIPPVTWSTWAVPTSR